MLLNPTIMLVEDEPSINELELLRSLADEHIPHPTERFTALLAVDHRRPALPRAQAVAA